MSEYGYDQQNCLDGIEQNRDTLFNLADQISEAENARWNVIIGDDTSGRLPTHFLRRVLKSEGLVLPTFYTTGSAEYRNRHGTKPYTDYFDAIQGYIGEPLRPLIITESVSSGVTATFLKQALQPVCNGSPEIAALAVHPRSATFVDYAGSTTVAALVETRHAYESIVRQPLGRAVLVNVSNKLHPRLKQVIKQVTGIRVNPPSPNTTVGIAPNLTSIVPIAKLLADRSPRTAIAAFQLMDRLAEEYRLTKILDAPNTTLKSRDIQKQSVEV